jgi:hypothetical protein
MTIQRRFSLEESMRASRILCLALVAAWLALPRAAHADGFMTPFIGGSNGGTIAEIGVDRPRSWGVSFGWMSGEIIGMETDISFSPDFYGDSESLFIGTNSVTTTTVNLIVGVPIGKGRGFSVRPYGTGGIGWFRQRVDGFNSIFDYRKNSVGYDVGGGAFVFFSAHIGARVDVRLFKSAWDAGDAIDAAVDYFDVDIDPSLIPEPERKISFTRTTFGLVFRW